MAESTQLDSATPPGPCDDQFETTWASPSRFPDWLAAVNNQPLGQRFMVTSFVFFALGGVLALLMRIQLTVSNNTFLSPDTYNQFFTVHGSTMMFLFAVPFLEGLALYILPMMIGSRDVAYPRLTAFGYWAYLFGGILFYSSFVFGVAPDVGWFGYTPLSGPRFSGIGTDFWLLGLTMVEFAGITAAIEIIVTVLKMRAPGMTLNRLPLFAWTIMVVGIMILFAFTTLLTATILLEFDRAAGTRFFDEHRGGHGLLWQHLFWFFGHPEVYIMFLPATGIVSMVVPVFARKPTVGYTLIAVSGVVMGFVSFGLWVHHMFATGLPALSLTLFMAASLMIAMASGTQIFAWIATMWGTRPRLTVPMMYVLGFIFLFVLGGLTGVMVAVIPFDWQVHDTFFVVAHFHYVLIGGVVFPVFAGIHFWWPKMTGRRLTPWLGHVGFWLNFIGFNLTFFPMHIMGFLGMPRRISTYPPELMIDEYNIVATIGAFLLGAGFLAIVIDTLSSFRKPADVGNNPWNADTLEWTLSSPPAGYSFRVPPFVGSRHPLWDSGPEEQENIVVKRMREALDGQPCAWRGNLITDVLDANPQSIQWLPGPTYTPLVVASGLLVAMVGVLTQAYILGGVGTLFTVGGLIQWLWPKQETIDLLKHSDVGRQSGLTLFPLGTASTAWWGMLGFVCVMGVVLAVLLFSYFYIWLYSQRWPQDGLPLPELLIPALGPGSMLLGAAAQWLAARSMRVRSRMWLQGSLGVVLLALATYLGVQLYAQVNQPFLPTQNAYASLMFVISLYAAIVAVVAMPVILATIARVRREHIELPEISPLMVQISSMYVYFVATTAVLVYVVLRVMPYVIGEGTIPFTS